MRNTDREDLIIAGNLCCAIWRNHVTNIKVIPTIDIPYLDRDRILADTLEKIIKSDLGNYCPKCGTKLKEEL